MNHHDPPHDPMFDTLLAEASGGPAPPDLTEQILRALASGESRGNSVDGADRASVPEPPPIIRPLAEPRPALAVDTVSRPRRDSGATPRRRPVAVGAGIAALAASVVLMGTWYTTRPEPGGGTVVVTDPDRAIGGDPPAEAVAHQQHNATGDSPAELAPGDDGPQGLADASATGPGEATILESPDFGPRTDAAGQHVSGVLVATFDYPPPPARIEDAAIVAGIDARLEQAWGEWSLEPSPLVDEQQWRERVAEVLGSPVSVDPENIPASLRRSLVQSEDVRGHIAQAFANALLGPVGAGRISGEHRQAFASWLMPVVSGEVPFDEAAQQILEANGPLDPQHAEFDPAVAWYASLAGPHSVPIAEQFGHAMLDMDLRCGRCHDHPLDGRVGQSQYWQLNALFETGLRWSAGDGQGLSVERPAEEASGPDPVVFYELADGRQRAAFPRIPAPWLWGDAGELPAGVADQAELPARGIEHLALGMRDNPQLARAAVNRVWEMVYGRPLVGSSANPSAPPESPALLALHTELADQLRAHDYDLSRLIAWVVAARPMRLASPTEFESPAYEQASEAQLRLAAQRLRGFASYPRSIEPQPLDRLVAMVQADSGGMILTPGAGDTLLGQVGVDSPTGVPVVDAAPGTAPAPPRTDAQVQEERLRASLAAATRAASTADGTGYPADWLGQIQGGDTFQAQAEHLFYLAGYWSPSPRHLELAQSIRDGSESDAEALRRLWWVLTLSR